MARRRRLNLAVVCAAIGAGCYEPEPINCTLSCAGPDECADGQICGNDGFCATPEIAGRCSGHETDEPPAALVTLEIVIEGNGKVSLDGLGSCDTRTADSDTCRFSVTRDRPVQLKAHDTNQDAFVSWTQTCAGEIATCVITPVMPLTRVGAEFD